MSNLRPKRKAKIRPCPPPSSPLSALCLLPPTLLTIVSLLSPSDREVLAYLILRSLQNPTASSPKPPTKQCSTPAFDCGCFGCYTSFWVRWDSSPNRELIHQAIEAFEDHIADLSANTHKALPRRLSREQCRKCSTQTKKGICKKDSVSAGETTKVEGVLAQEQHTSAGVACQEEEEEEENVEEEASCTSVRRSAGGGGSCSSSRRRGLVRMVWPDVLGLCNSRLWSLWCPNV